MTLGYIIIICGVLVLIIRTYHSSHKAKELVEKKFLVCLNCHSQHPRYFVVCKSKTYCEDTARSDEPSNAHYEYTYGAFSKCNTCAQHISSIDNIIPNHHLSIEQRQAVEINKEEFIRIIKTSQYPYSFLKFLGWFLIVSATIYLFIFF